MKGYRKSRKWDRGSVNKERRRKTAENSLQGGHRVRGRPGLVPEGCEVRAHDLLASVASLQEKTPGNQKSFFCYRVPCPSSSLY